MELKQLYRALKKALVKTCQETVEETAEYIKNEAQKRATLDMDEVFYSGFKGHNNIAQFETYKDRFDIKVYEPENVTFKARAYNSYLVVSEKVGIVPFGNFVEWGTGLTGLNTEDGTWSPSDYTLTPWDERTWQQNIDMGTFGMAACPHWSPAREKAKEEVKKIFSAKLKENT